MEREISLKPKGYKLAIRLLSDPGLYSRLFLFMFLLGGALSRKFILDLEEKTSAIRFPAQRAALVQAATRAALTEALLNLYIAYIEGRKR